MTNISYEPEALCRKLVFCSITLRRKQSLALLCSSMIITSFKMWTNAPCFVTWNFLAFFVHWCVSKESDQSTECEIINNNCDENRFFINITNQKSVRTEFAFLPHYTFDPYHKVTYKDLSLPSQASCKYLNKHRLCCGLHWCWLGVPFSSILSLNWSVLPESCSLDLLSDAGGLL